jgi:hypothetical protein
MLKIYVEFNRLGQPCGLRGANFSNYITYLAKKSDISGMLSLCRQMYTSENEMLHNAMIELIELKYAHILCVLS